MIRPPKGGGVFRVKLRGTIAVVCMLLGFLVLDLVQRLVIAPWVWLRPSSRHIVLTRWIHFLAWFLIATPRYIGGAKFQKPPKIPSGPGILILMNHQSVFDLPLVVSAVDQGYPLVVTRERYSRRIPVISQMVKLYQYPTVNPVANAGTLRGMIKKLRAAARTTEVPLMVFPEGTRSKDGEIAPLKVKGLELVLRARPWKVYVVVVDGLWRTAKVKDLIAGMSEINARVELAGTLDWDDPKADPEPFAAEVRKLMVECLHRIREATPVA